MKKSIYVFFFFVLALSMYANTFSIQGVLRDPLGKTVEDAYYQLTFKLYDAESGGNLIWSEVQGSVATSHGVYGVELGSETSLDNVPFDTPYWLGITVGNESEMEPRIKLTRTPSAMSVYGTDNVVPSVGNMGIGTHSPNAALHIKNKNNETNVLLVEDNSGNIQLKTTESGKVGVGVEPNADLHIKTSNSEDKLFIENADGSINLKSTNNNKLGLGIEPEADLHIKTSNDNDKLLIENSSGDNFVRVTNDGKLGVKVDTPTQSLDVDGNVRLRNGGAIMFDDGSALSTANFGGTAESLVSNGNTLITTDADGNGSGEVQVMSGTNTIAKITNEGRIKDVTGYVAPVGTITMFAGSVAPEGWLICDGSTVSSSLYPNLFSVIGTNFGGSASSFMLPNFTGRTPVGLNGSDSSFDNLGETGGSKTHTLTTEELPSHSHTVDPPNTNTTNDGNHTHPVNPPSTTTNSDTHSHPYSDYYWHDSGSDSNYGTPDGDGTGQRKTASRTTSNDTHSHTVDIAQFNSGSAGAHAHSVNIGQFNSGSTGSGQAHNILQPYFTINFIIKY